MSSPQGYTRSQIILHWLVAVLIVPQFVFKDAISRAFGAVMKGEEAVISPFVQLHVLTGVLIFALVVWRIVLRRRLGVPEAPAADSPVQVMIAKSVHHGLYSVLALMVVSGGMAWFGGIGFAGGVHGVLKLLLLALVALHVLGALKQQFIQKTNIMDRMKTPRG